MRMTIVRATSFSSAHRYWDTRFDEARNRALYGSWYRDEGFGHNFRLEASFTGDVDPLSGMIVNLTEIDAWLRSLRAVLDHRVLNELPEFAGLAPTPERVAGVCFDLLDRAAGPRLVGVRLYEGDSLWVDCLRSSTGG